MLLFLFARLVLMSLNCNINVTALSRFAVDIAVDQLGVFLMAGLSIWHVVIFAIVVILLFGTSKLKNLGKDVGGAVKDFKKSIKEEETTTTASINEPRTLEHQTTNSDVNSTVKQ